MHLADPTFPPLLTGVPVKGRPGPFESACSVADEGGADPGSVFWARDTSVCSAAIVLAPEVAASQAMQMLYTAMVAFGDAFGAIAPPELGLFYRWPATFMVNAAQIGRLRVGLPPDARAGDVPRWLVVGVEVAISNIKRDHEPGDDLEFTTLFDEGCGDLDRTQLIESFCRHFLVWLHTWNDEGFRAVHDAWMGRLEERDSEITFQHQGASIKGQVLGLDEDGNMLLKTADETLVLSAFDTAERLPADNAS